MAELDSDFSFFRGFRLKTSLEGLVPFGSEEEVYISSTGRFDLMVSGGIREIQEDYVLINKEIYFPDYDFSENISDEI